MTARTITTAAELEALPVGSVVRTARGAMATRHECARGWLIAGFFGPQKLYPDTDLPAVVLHDPSAPVVPVVSDAAVEAGARALFEEMQELDQENSWDDPLPDEWREAWRDAARETLTAALPHLVAVPSVTREDVTITPRTDR